MLDLLTRIDKIDKILAQPFSNKTKLIRSVRQFSGQNLTDLESTIRTMLESSLLKVNQVMRQYDVVTVDDYSKIKKKDIQRLLCVISTLSHNLRDSLNRMVG